MGTPKKHTFYPVNEVAVELKEVPRGQLSERVNELILKGLTAERQAEVAKAYIAYDLALAKNSQGYLEENSDRVMSAGAFQAEDEVEDFA